MPTNLNPITMDEYNAVRNFLIKKYKKDISGIANQAYIKYGYKPLTDEQQLKMINSNPDLIGAARKVLKRSKIA